MPRQKYPQNKIYKKAKSGVQKKEMLFTPKLKPVPGFGPRRTWAK